MATDRARPVGHDPRFESPEGGTRQLGEVRNSWTTVVGRRSVEASDAVIAAARAVFGRSATSSWFAFPAVAAPGGYVHRTSAEPRAPPRFSESHQRGQDECRCSGLGESVDADQDLSAHLGAGRAEREEGHGDVPSGEQGRIGLAPRCRAS